MSAEVEYLDSGVLVGRTATAGSTEIPDLLALLDRTGVAGAAIQHAVAREHDPATGNRLTSDAAATSSRLLPVWTALPHHTGEFPPPDEFVEEAASSGVRLARMFPSSELSGHRFALRSWVTGDLLSALEKARMPLLLDFTIFRRGEPPWDDIAGVCADHPRLPVILVEVQGRNNRTLYPLLERFPELRVQTGGFNVHAGLEDVCARFGAERLVFGSNHPFSSLGAARLHLERALISDGERRLIASGNLRSLLSQAHGGGLA